MVTKEGEMKREIEYRAVINETRVRVYQFLSGIDERGFDNILNFLPLYEVRPTIHFHSHDMIGGRSYLAGYSISAKIRYRGPNEEWESEDEICTIQRDEIDKMRHQFMLKRLNGDRL